jgi:tripartite-type tricarboxylate transporter receptor subunit TctC
MAPAGTPKAVVDKLNAEIRRIVATAEIKAAWDKQGAVAMSMTPEEFGRFMREDIEKWSRIVKISGAKPDR